jgi:hypothetical protein
MSRKHAARNFVKLFSGLVRPAAEADQPASLAAVSGTDICLIERGVGFLLLRSNNGWLNSL